ncbi:hypothetical protein REPUB_Repub12eG0103700 [Reevesia pubescens]
MQKLVSSWYHDQSLPQSYMFPPETGPCKLVFPRCNNVLVVDLSKTLDHNQNDTIQKILKASQKCGFFQVINHGVLEKLMNDTMSVFKEFFEMPADDKASIYSEDIEKSCRLYTSGLFYSNEKVHLWRDSLRHPCHPLEIFNLYLLNHREVIATYSVKVKKLGLRILELLSEDLGLEFGYFGRKLSEVKLLIVNHYPPHSNPSLTLGLPKHCDPNLITIMLHGDVQGI